MNCNFSFLFIFKMNKRGRGTNIVLEGEEVLAFASLPPSSRGLAGRLSGQVPAVASFSLCTGLVSLGRWLKFSGPPFFICVPGKYLYLPDRRVVRICCVSSSKTQSAWHVMRIQMLTALLLLLIIEMNKGIQNIGHIMNWLWNSAIEMPRTPRIF